MSHPRNDGRWNRLWGGGPVKQSDAQWAHAAKVALGATAVVGALAVLLALAANLLIVRHLDQNVDNRLDERLASASRSPVNPLATIAVSPSGDLDDAPTFLWLVRPDGASTALMAGAPRLPAHHWSSGGVTLPTAGSPFRFDTVGLDGGWLVVGESVSKIGQARDQLLIAEGVLGALLLLVTFVGSFVVGLRASAPIEQIRRRQAEFTADASHELRTPLSVIEAEVDLALSRERSAAAYQDTLRRVASESGRLRSIVEDLLWLARADGSPPEERADQVADVAEVGSTCLSRFRAVADAASVTLTNRIDPDGACLIHADADSIDRLITVLLDNACRYAAIRGGRARRRPRGRHARRTGGADRRRLRARGSPRTTATWSSTGSTGPTRPRAGPGWAWPSPTRWSGTAVAPGPWAPRRWGVPGWRCPGARPTCRPPWPRPSPSRSPRTGRNHCDLGLFFGES